MPTRSRYHDNHGHACIFVACLLRYKRSGMRSVQCSVSCHACMCVAMISRFFELRAAVMHMPCNAGSVGGNGIVAETGIKRIHAILKPLISSS